MPEENGTIRIPVRDCKITATITISKEKGITALYCGKIKKIATYIFDKSKGWTMASAKKWVKEHSKKRLKLPKYLVEKLKGLPESGMGYQIVNLKLKDGTILKNITVFNSSIAIVDKDIDVSQIEDVELVTKKDFISPDAVGFIRPQYGKPPKKRRRRRKKKPKNSKALPAVFLTKEAIAQIIRRQKKAIVRIVDNQKIIGKDIYVCGDSAYGIINLNEPLKVDFDQFRNLKSRHLIEEDVGEKLFEGRKHLYIYNFKIKKIFKEALRYKTKEDTEFSESISILENLRMYRFKEEDVNLELLEKSEYEDLVHYQYVLYGLYKRAKRQGKTLLKAIVYSYAAITLKILLKKIEMQEEKDIG